MTGNISIIYGPMFSGKTTKLINLYNKDIEEGYRCLAINYRLDNRYSKNLEDNNYIFSHDGEKIECISIIKLDELTNNLDNLELLNNSDKIYINEGQFFTELLEWCLYVINYLNKDIIICGLDLNYKREIFGDILKLLPYAKFKYKMNSKCHTKDCKNSSIYSYRLVKDKNNIMIGTNEYIALCESCFNLRMVA